MTGKRSGGILVSGFLLVCFQSTLIVAQETEIDFDESRFQTHVSQLEESSPVQRENATEAIVAEFGVDCVARLAIFIADSGEGADHPCVSVLDRIGDSQDARTVALVGCVYHLLAQQSVLAKEHDGQGNQNENYLQRIQQRRKGRPGLTTLNKKVLQQGRRLRSLDRQQWLNELPLSLELSRHDGRHQRIIYMPDVRSDKTHRIEQFTTPDSSDIELLNPEKFENQMVELLSNDESTLRDAFLAIETELSGKLEQSVGTHRKMVSGTFREIAMEECFKLVITKEWSGDTDSLDGIADLPCLSSVTIREQVVDKSFLDCLQAWTIAGPVVLEDCQVDQPALAAFVEQQTVPERMNVVNGRSEAFIGLAVQSTRRGEQIFCSIRRTVPFSPASAAGIRPSDGKIIAINGITINYASTFNAIRQCLIPGEEVELEIEHNDGTRSKKMLVVQARD